jgi:hypothetical protein
MNAPQEVGPYPPITRQVNCETCGAPLLRVLGKETITTLDGEEVLFRRTSDYLLCRNCLHLYPIGSVRLENSPNADYGDDGSPQGSDGPDGENLASTGGDAAYFGALDFDAVQLADEVIVVKAPREEAAPDGDLATSEPIPLEDQFDQ